MPTYYAHTPTGTVWTLIGTKPLTLKETLKDPFHPRVRRPTRITFARDYKKIGV